MPNAIIDESLAVLNIEIRAHHYRIAIGGLIGVGLLDACDRVLLD